MQFSFGVGGHGTSICLALEIRGGSGDRVLLADGISLVSVCAEMW